MQTRGAGVVDAHIGFERATAETNAEELADWEHRRPVTQWWMRLRPIIDTLGGRLEAAVEEVEVDVGGQAVEGGPDVRGRVRVSTVFVQRAPEPESTDTSTDTTEEHA